MENPIRSTRTDDGNATVTVVGEIDFANAERVSRGIHDALTLWAPPLIEVDLQDATFMDSTGLGALIDGYRATAESDTEFRVINPSVSFRRVLTVTGLCELFGLNDEAVGGIATSA